MKIGIGFLKIGLKVRLGRNYFQGVTFSPVVRAHAAVHSSLSAKDLTNAIIRDCLTPELKIDREAAAVYRNYLKIRPIKSVIDLELDIIVAKKSDTDPESNLSRVYHELKIELGILPAKQI